MFYIGEFYEKSETLFNEYKEFTLDIEKIKDISVIDIKRYNKGYMDLRLSNIIEECMIQHIEKYFPKYYTSFNNTKTIENGIRTSSGGILTIGINDDSIITGIPVFNYEKSKDIIYNKLYTSILSQYKNIYDKNGINIDPFNNFELNIIRIEKKILTKYDKLKNTIKDFNNIQKIFKKNQRIIKKYRYEHKKWNKLMCLYGIKLTTVLDDKKIKKEFVSYVLKVYFDLLQSSYEENISVIVTDYKKRSVILLINDYDIILKKFKDDMRNMLKTIKPVKPNISYREYIQIEYYRLTRLISNINSFVINNNITYILIKIKILNDISVGPVDETDWLKSGGRQQVPLNEVPLNEVPLNEVPLNEVPLNEVPLNEVPLNKILYYKKNNKMISQNRIINIYNNSPENYNILIEDYDTEDTIKYLF
jgi:hypothetical protein